MKKALFFLLWCVATLALTACGDDEPELVRDRDVTMTVDALTHVRNTANGKVSLSEANRNTVVVHQKALTADFALQVTLGGTQRTFTVDGVALKLVEDTHRYTFAASTTQVQNLTGIVDLSEQVLLLDYDVDSYHVSTTIPDVFFAQTGIRFDYSDGSTTSTSLSFWTFKVASDCNTASITIGDLEIARDTVANVEVTADGKRIVKNDRSGRYLSSLISHGATVTPTVNGFTVTADVLSAVGTSGANGDIAAGNTQHTNDYELRDVALMVNIVGGRLDGTMVLRHILERDADGIATKWDDINAFISGVTYKTPFGDD